MPIRREMRSKVRDRHIIKLYAVIRINVLD